MGEGQARAAAVTPFSAAVAAHPCLGTGGLLLMLQLSVLEAQLRCSPPGTSTGHQQQETDAQQDACSATGSVAGRHCSVQYTQACVLSGLEAAA